MAHPYKMVACDHYDILVPFLCRRCGNCCRRYDPLIEMELLPEIARTLREPIDVIQDRLRKKRLSHQAGLSEDCCFLHPGQSLCMIHEVRPTACRQYPALVETGAGTVDCAGHREFREALKAVTSDREHLRRRQVGRRCGKRPMPDQEQVAVLNAIDVSGISDAYRLVFRTLNGITNLP